jgi:DNA-binding PadR family transcriptional regulator
VAENSVRTMNPDPIIADRGEFVDALNRLRRGHVLVKVGEATGGCVLDGGVLYRSYEPLVRYGLIDEFKNPQGFEQASYYRLTPRGREFADRACSAWRQRPLWQRLAVRLAG